MENNELKKYILKNVKSKIVISNLESEESMKINMKKQVFAVLAVIMLVLVGGFFSVNAATDGKLIENIKEVIKVTMIKDDGVVVQLDGKEYTDSNGDNWVHYENENTQIDVNKKEIDVNNLSLETQITEYEVSTEIKEKDRKSVV